MRQMRNTVLMIVIVTFITIFFMLPMISMAGKTHLGVINGRVLNATLDRKGIKGLEVILRSSAKGQKMRPLHTKTDSKGLFLFKDLQADKNMNYRLWTQYKNIEYTSPIVHLDKGNSQTLDLPVYETTDQDSNIFIKMDHIFLDMDHDFIHISEAVIIENRGSRVYVGSGGPSSRKHETFQVSLPKEAINVQFDQLTVPFMIKTLDGFVYTSEIKPGAKKILFSYAIKSTDFNNKIIMHLPYQTDNLYVIFPDKGFTVTSRQVAFTKQVQNSGRQFYLLSGKDFAKGSQVILNINPVKNKKSFQWVVVGLLALFIAVGAAIPLIKRRNSQSSSNERSIAGGSMNAPDQRQAVMQAIAKLDDLADSGGIDPEIYEKERNELLAQAKTFSRLLGSDDPSSSESSEP